VCYSEKSKKNGKATRLGEELDADGHSAWGSNILHEEKKAEYLM
jgi:hypothetical protein